MLNLVSLLIGVVALVFALIAFLPLLGWANWFIIPLAALRRRLDPECQGPILRTVGEGVGGRSVGPCPRARRCEEVRDGDLIVGEPAALPAVVVEDLAAPADVVEVVALEVQLDPGMPPYQV